MRILFKNIQLCFPGHPLHEKSRDLFLEYNKIGAIGKNLKPPNRTRVLEGGVLAPGFVDIGAFSGEPGYEHRETLKTLIKAGARGGYTHVFVVPNVHPVTDNRAAAQFLMNKDALIDIQPLGAISQGVKGQDLAEIYDMNRAGIGAFTDGLEPVSSVGLMKRALQYVNTFDGLIINTPYEKSIEPDGIMHESIISTSMGLKGIPEMAEIVMLKRDIDILEYTGSRLLSHQISSEKSIPILKAARKRLPDLHASVAFLNLIRTHKSLADFDTNSIVLPPLREEKDRQALIQALLDNTLDCIVSGHLPVEEEWKKIEFAQAKYGASTLPLVFPVLHDQLKNKVSLEHLIKWLALHPRQILGMDRVVPEEGQEIDFTWIGPDQETRFSASDYPSKSKNSSLLDQSWKGRIKGVFYREDYSLYDS